MGFLRVKHSILQEIHGKILRRFRLFVNETERKYFTMFFLSLSNKSFSQVFKKTICFREWVEVSKSSYQYPHNISRGDTIGVILKWIFYLSFFLLLPFFRPHIPRRAAIRTSSEHSIKPKIELFHGNPRFVDKNMFIRSLLLFWQWKLMRTLR